MRPFGETIPLDRARTLIDDAIRPIDRTERVALADADRRVLAADLVSAADVPPFPRAAMDGYAVRAADTTGATRDTPRTLTWIEKVFTGCRLTWLIIATTALESRPPLKNAPSGTSLISRRRTASFSRSRISSHSCASLQRVFRQ